MQMGKNSDSIVLWLRRIFRALLLSLLPKKLVLQWFSISILHQIISTDKRLICSRKVFGWIENKTRKHQKFNSPEQLRSFVVISLEIIKSPSQLHLRDWTVMSCSRTRNLQIKILNLRFHESRWWSAESKSFSIACRGTFACLLCVWVARWRLIRLLQWYWEVERES